MVGNAPSAAVKLKLWTPPTKLHRSRDCLMARGACIAGDVEANSLCTYPGNAPARERVRESPPPRLSPFSGGTSC